jgi:predicted nucleic acid-binding protein
MEKITVYLDNCAFNRPFDDQRQVRIFLEAQAKLHIQRLIADNKLALACSYMSLYENNDNPHEERRFSIAEFFNHASQFTNYDKIEEVETKAAGIMEYGIKNKDAIHIACAIAVKSDYFITTDDDLAKKYTGNEICICGPIDFIKILEELYE